MEVKLRKWKQSIISFYVLSVGPSISFWNIFFLLSFFLSFFWLKNYQNMINLHKKVFIFLADYFLSGNQQLLPGDYILSRNKCFKLIHQNNDDGYLEMINVKSNESLWVSGTINSVRAKMQSDGNFVLYNSDSKVQWSSGTAGNPESILEMQDDGNIVIYNKLRKSIWASQTISFCPGTT